MEIVRIKFGENQVPSSEFPGILRQCHHDRVAHAPNLSLHLHTMSALGEVAHKQAIVLGSCRSVTKRHLSMAPSHIMISCLNREEESQKAHE